MDKTPPEQTIIPYQRAPLSTTTLVQTHFIRAECPIRGDRAIIRFEYRGQVTIPDQLILSEEVRDVIVIGSALINYAENVRIARVLDKVPEHIRLIVPDNIAPMVNRATITANLTLSAAIHFGNQGDEIPRDAMFVL